MSKSPAAGRQAIKSVLLEEEEIPSISRRLEEAGAEGVIRWALERYGEELTLSVSFGGAEGMVLLDMLVRQMERTGIDAWVYTLDTGFLFEATVEYRERVLARYPNLKFKVVEPRLTVEEQVRKYGPELWSCVPDLCCQARKIEPQQRWLGDFSAWMTGIRRDQTAARSDTPVVERDEFFRVDKIAPLAGWSKGDVDRYVEEHGLELNPLLSQGYRSIGCEPCTRPVAEGEDYRAGRWSGSDKVECGLHIVNGKVGRTS
ncbi:cysH: phosophoadenylyl-sulfate reductase [Rubrobacter radiotolerans]|uniref:Adenosine 5'-phosphosulfate reductase n=1 Tax=Rubrobacter radiotolerans TaxID=42256 RepID=A0A023X1T3_RUBRA|nr:phosphoadenylyl-sulfate reductase [Rubrobacter radiotolerans]AHY46156.1 cysH: phosophoadenylyl-sulfate reductase [Rubrobacter radiotolerans]MDX5893566.1 phosphoadenylyl-sulfate reductase [Rubrobacter radiotolerans]SMC04005.1 phosphoadenylylsulfate reductase (thioredoxin) [Rubrobacter radiotolerans DSM 5868]